MTRITIAAVLLSLAAVPAAADDSDWFIVGENGGLWTGNISHPIVRVLAERGALGRPVTGLAFTPHDEWVALVGGNEFYFSGESAATRKLQEWWAEPAAWDYRCVAFAPQGGWVGIGGDNRFAAENIPADLLAKLTELRKQNIPIRSVAFAPNGGWVLLGDGGDIWYRDLPANAARKLDDLREAKTPVRCIAFDHGGNWVIVAERNGIWSNNLDLPVFKQLLDLKNKKVPIRWVALAPGESPGGYEVVREPTHHVSALVELELGHLGGRVDSWTLYSPAAPAHGGQERMRTSLSPGGHQAKELSPQERAILEVRLAGSPRPLRANLAIEGDLYARRLYPRLAASPAVPDLDPASSRIYTRATDHINFDSRAFQDWLDRADLRRRADERDITFARRVFAFIRDRFSYIYPAGDEHAMAVCARGRSDCGGLAITLVAILRANGIPARMLQGRWACSDDGSFFHPHSVPGQYHVKAEFFAKGTGWIPVDPSAAVCDKENGGFAHFGNDPGDFITLFIDPDYEVVAPTGRVRGLALQGILWFWKGEGSPKFGLAEKWTVNKDVVK